MSNQLPGILADIHRIIHHAQTEAVRAVQITRTKMYWLIGQRILEEEQAGAERATYGSHLIQQLASQLVPEYGNSYSKRQLELMRQFYRAYPNVNTLYSQLSWSHYRLLIRIEDEDKKEFYQEESRKNNWTVRQLERQINSQLYERLLLSNDKDRVLAIAKGEGQPEVPTEIIKDPTILEFLGLRREAAYYEKDLEQAIITHMQGFLLELGNGFSFVARQKRIQLDGDDFFVDLVFSTDCCKVLCSLN